MKDINYFTIHGWMTIRLGLKGIERELFAILYGFSQDGESYFTGSLSYLQKWVIASRPTVIKTLKTLVKKGFK